MQPADRIRVFRHTLEEAVSERVVPGPHTVGLFADSVANVYDLNYLRAAEPAPAVVLADEAEHAMETFLHRKVVVERDGREAASGFAALGWNVTPHLIMARQREADRVVDTSMVREVDFDELLDARREVTVAEPTGDPSLSQLLDRGKRRIIAAVPTRFFAAFVDGRVAAYCELRSDGAVAQIEDVNTLAEFRGRGLGRAVVQARARRGGPQRRARVPRGARRRLAEGALREARLRRRRRARALPATAVAADQAARAHAEAGAAARHGRRAAIARARRAGRHPRP